MSSINQIASDLYKSITESSGKKPKPYDTKAEVLRTEGDIVWVKIPGGVDETPVQKTNNASTGDTVMVRISGGRAWLLGNNTSPATDDTRANQAYQVGFDAGVVADIAIKDAAAAQESATIAAIAADNAVTEAGRAKDAADSAQTSADQAISDAATASQAASVADGKAVAAGQAASAAQTSADQASQAASEADSKATAAATAAQAANTAATEAKSDAAAAHTAANNALTELSTVEDVVGTVEWAASHSGQDMADYINSHLALTTYGLDLVLDNTSYRIHIGTHTATGDDGVYVIDDDGNVVSFFGEDIKFDSDHAQYIGNNNAYIVFDPTGNSGQGSLTIGGSSIQIGNRNLEDVLGKTLIYDHTYEYVRDSNNKPISANFTAFLYRGGIDVKNEYSASNFTWYLKKEDKATGAVVEALIGTGYTCSVSLSTCGYGAEVIGKFTLVDDTDALSTDGDNLTDTNNENLSVRATGDSVRVRDLSVSTTIFPTDKLMVVGSEDEHLVSVQTLQDYLNANLDKQVLFNTNYGGTSAKATADASGNTITSYYAPKSTAVTNVALSTNKITKTINGTTTDVVTAATTSTYGITKLSTSTSSTATDLAATPSAVKTAYDLANTANGTANTALSGVNGTLIYDHTYTISNGVATFVPHVYQKGAEVTSNYAASCFTWKYRLDNNVTGTPSYVNLTTDSTTKGCTVTISALGYGGHVIGTFTPT